jgi:hypothetical protein
VAAMSALVQVGHDLPTQAQREDPRFRTSLDLVALPTAVPVARLFVADTLRRWQAMFVEPDMEAVAAELVALAVQATGPLDNVKWSDIHQLGPITLRLLGFREHIVVEVADNHAHALTFPEDVELAIDHGLRVVDALATQWGSYPTPHGRVTWAQLAVYERTRAGLPRRTQRRSCPRPPTGTAEPPPPDMDLLRRVRDRLGEL